MQLKDLKPNKRNPRKITQKKKDLLKKSLDKFGDLSGTIYNIRTKSLVGGHQRSSVLPQNSTIKIEKKYDKPTRTGTVAEGYIEHEGERYKFREVDWNETMEAEAMLAANKHQGEWDKDILKLLAVDIPDIDFEIAGFEDFEIPEIPAPQTDEQYVRETPKTEEEIPTERTNNTVFEKTEEKAMDVVGRRFVLIIDCTSLEHKEALREKIQPLVVEAGGKFY